MKFLLSASFAFSILASLLQPIASAQSVSPKPFSDTAQIVGNWSADQHLWTNGTLPVSSRNLADLEKWLDENAPNWTVVLMQNARQQRYQGRSGLNAVEHSLGEKLPNQTGFSKMLDSRVAQKNGAIFVLFLEERKFSYFSSDAMDFRRLGHRRWVGDLDKPAIRAMRNGGRIVDAVKDTISNIETKLTKAIAGEIAAKKRAEIERKRALEEVKLLSGKVMGEIDEALAFADEFRSRFPKLEGDLLEDNAPSWRANAKAVADFAVANQVKEAHELAGQTRSQLLDFRRNLQLWEKNAEAIARLEKRIEGMRGNYGVASVDGLAAQARDAFRSASENYLHGDSIYRQQLETGNRLVSQTESEFQSWQAAVAAEKKQQEARELTNKIALIVAGILFIVALIVANRMRRPAKLEAEDLLKSWKRQLKGKFDRLFELMDRTTILVGSSSEGENREFSGTTEELRKKAIREVDELFIMSSATDQVMDDVEKSVEPGSFWGGLVNLFSWTRYQRATELLTSKAIGFDRDQGLASIISPKNRELLGAEGDYKPFKMSFKRLIEIYDDKQTTARETVERLGAGIDGLPLKAEELTQKLSEISEGQLQTSEWAAEDHFFHLTNLGIKLIPAIESNLKSARKIGKKDPVAALEGPINIAIRQLKNGNWLAARIGMARHKFRENVEEKVATLESHGRRIRWVDELLNSLTSKSEALAELAVERDADQDLNEFGDSLIKAWGRIASCALISKGAENEIPEMIEKARRKVSGARISLSEKLNMPIKKILVEENLNPDDRLAAAGVELEAARSALNLGNNAVALGDVEDIEGLIDEVADLILQSRSTADHFKSWKTELTDRGETQKSKVQPTATLLEDLIQNYDSEVLRFSVRFGTEPLGQDSVRDSIKAAEGHLQSFDEALSNAASAFADGRLIEASGRSERAGNELDFATHQIALIEDQHAALKAAEAANQSRHSEYLEKVKALESQISDFRTMTKTVESHLVLSKYLGVVSKKFEVASPNPFEIKHDLDTSQRNLEAVEQSIATDWECFDSAENAIRKARRVLKQSDSLIQTAKTDNITESVDLTKAIQHHKNLTEFVEKADAYLKTEHGNWPGVEKEAADVAADALVVRGAIDHELQRANLAVVKIHEATNAISNLRGWRSSHGIRRDKSAGSFEFTEAQNALASGQYEQARQFAENSRAHADRALKLAEAREREAEAERRRAAAAAAAARRRAARAASFSSSSGSSFGSLIGGSGFSRSSFSSGSSGSSSGFSRSGW